METEKFNFLITNAADGLSPCEITVKVNDSTLEVVNIGCEDNLPLGAVDCICQELSERYGDGRFMNRELLNYDNLKKMVGNHGFDKPFNIAYSAGQSIGELRGRMKTIERIIELLKANPNMDSLELLRVI